MSVYVCQQTKKWFWRHVLYTHHINGSIISAELNCFADSEKNAGTCGVVIKTQPDSTILVKIGIYYKLYLYRLQLLEVFLRLKVLQHVPFVIHFYLNFHTIFLKFSFLVCSLLQLATELGVIFLPVFRTSVVYFYFFLHFYGSLYLSLNSWYHHTTPFNIKKNFFDCMCVLINTFI